MMNTAQTYRKTCEYCGKEFHACHSRTRYCSPRCSKLGHKHQKRNERIRNTSFEVRETERLALLDKNYMTITDAARLLQVSRNTMYKIIETGNLKTQHFTPRTIRVSRIDLDKFVAAPTTTKEITTESSDLGNLMTREQVMETYDVTYSWFYSTLKKRGIKTRMIGTTGFYDKQQMEEAFGSKEFLHIKEWYTFEELKKQTGMRSESISDYCKDRKIPRKKKNGITYVSKEHWDQARGNTYDLSQYYTIAQLSEKYNISKNQLFCVLREKQVNRIKIGLYTYIPKAEAEQALKYRTQQ